MEGPQSTVHPTAEDIKVQRAEIIGQIKGQEEILTAVELLPEVFRVFNIETLTAEDIDVIKGIQVAVGTDSDSHHRLVRDMGSGDTYDKGQLDITLRNGQLILDKYGVHLRNLGNDGQQE